jgi:monothiol glutaredoxin
MSVLDEIKNQVTGHKVVLYMKGSPDILRSCGVNELFTVNVLENPEIRQGIKQYANWPTIPQLYVNGEFVGGSDIVTEMFQSGELKKMLQG